MKLTNNLRNIEAEITENKENFIREKEIKVIGNIKNDPKEFYRYARSKSNVKSDIGPLKDPIKKNILSDEKEMSEILSRQYKSMFSVPSMDIRDMDLEHLRSKTFSTLHNIEVTTSMIEQAIKDIPNDASPGPDGIGPLFLKNGGLFVYEALEDILKQSLSESYIPQIMKDIWITPL